MKQKTVVTISRYWKNPKIMTVIWNDGISLSISLEDFVSAVKAEMPRVATILKQATLEQKMDEAIDRVLEKIKEESLKVM